MDISIKSETGRWTRHFCLLLTLLSTYVPQGVIDVCKQVATNDKSLKKRLFLERQGINDYGASLLGAALATNRRLRKVFLGHNDIGPEGAKALAQGLCKNSSVKLIQLGSNKIGNDGATAFGTMLKTNRRVRKIYLLRNSIGDEGAKGLCQGLEQSTCSVEVINLCNNNIGNEGAEAIGHMLQRNRRIKELYLLGNPFGDQGKQDLLCGLRHNYTLEYFTIGYTDCSLSTEIDFFLRLNRAGRRLLRNDNFPTTLWAHVLANIRNKPALIFYFVQAKPDLFKFAQSE